MTESSNTPTLSLGAISHYTAENHGYDLYEILNGTDNANLSLGPNYRKIFIQGAAYPQFILLNQVTLETPVLPVSPKGECIYCFEIVGNQIQRVSYMSVVSQSQGRLGETNTAANEVMSAAA